MKTATVCTVLLLATSPLLLAQTVVEKIEVSLVNVDVTVTSHGAPAHGLTRDDFQILEDGVPQQITNFYAIENSPNRSPEAKVVSAAPASAEAAPQADERFRRRVLIVVDNRHTTRHDRDVALAKLEQFINDHFAEGAYDWSLAMITDRAHLLLPLTSDKTRIHDALATVRRAMAGKPVGAAAFINDRLADKPSQPVDPEAQWPGMMALADPRASIDAAKAIEQEANRFQTAADAFSTFDAITEVTRSFATTPGRKIVLLVTGGFGDSANPLDSADRIEAGHLAAALEVARQRLVHDANASDASIYVIGTAGLEPINIGADGMSHGSGGGMAPGSNVVGGSTFWLAKQTGGQVFMGNRVDESLQNFDRASSNFYSLAYKPPHGEDGKYHHITVRLTRPGRYTLSYREGYSSLPVGMQLARAMTSATAASMQRSNLNLKLTTGAPQDTNASNAVLVNMSMVVPAKELQFIPSSGGSVAMVDVYVSIFDENGRLITRFKTAREAHAKTGTEAAGEFIEEHSLRLRRKGTYRVVVAIHDQVTDAVGIAATTVSV
jgi:VWFA-related protein